MHSRAYSPLAQFVFLFAHFRCSHTNIHTLLHTRNCDAPSFNVWLRLTSTPTATPSPPPSTAPFLFSQLTKAAHPVYSHPRLVINLPASRKSPLRLLPSPLPLPATTLCTHLPSLHPPLHPPGALILRTQSEPSVSFSFSCLVSSSVSVPSPSCYLTRTLSLCLPLALSASCTCVCGWPDR